jgi:hypothetical protein
MRMTVLICGSPGSGFQIIGLFANSGDAQSYAEDYSLKDWWVTELISPRNLRKAKWRHCHRKESPGRAGTFEPDHKLGIKVP